MKTSSAKAKGRRACQEVVEKLYARAPHLLPGDIEVTSSGVTGEDIKLSPAARAFYPFAFECKNQESIQIWAAFEQAKRHAKPGQIPLLAYKRNKSELMVSLTLDDFLRICVPAV